MDEIKRIERRIRLHDVRVLISVVQARSMTKAAELLNTSQPSVSRAISDLEHVFGVPLIDRSSRGIEPTQYGRAIIKRGLAVFDELRQGFKDIEFLADPTAGELRIGCSEALAAGPVLVVINKLARRYPRLLFNVVTGAAPILYRELTERNVELVISWLTGAEDKKQMAVEILFHESVVVATGPQNPWTRRRKIQLAELINEPWTLLPYDNYVCALAMDAFRSSGLKLPQPTVITLSHNMRNRLVASGRFLTVQPGFSLRFSGKNVPLKALPVELPGARGTIAIVTLKKRTLSPLAELFVNNLRAVAKPLAKGIFP
jgi:DNA-binding transcriptional LysR family regulator